MSSNLVVSCWYVSILDMDVVDDVDLFDDLNTSMTIRKALKKDNT
jgi:hypothetical protein